MSLLMLRSEEVQVLRKNGVSNYYAHILYFDGDFRGLSPTKSNMNVINIRDYNVYSISNSLTMMCIGRKTHMEY